MVPRTACVRAYPVVEKHSWIWVWMGDPAKADPALIPPAVGFDDPNWTLRSGHMDYEANYILINDNLTDFTHLSYVHRNSFGTSEEFALTRPAILPLDRGIRVQRWLASAFRSDVDNLLTSQRNVPADNDQWQTYDYLAPGILLMYSAMYPAGFGESVGKRAPAAEDGPPLSANFTSQAVTPMTDQTSRYFFSWGPLAGEGSDEMAEGMLGLANVAFTEDKLIIEAQQKVINTTPEVKEVLTSADVGPMQMRSVISKLIKNESNMRGMQ
jgi:vanillate O-demethylase monooxygenase subunit